MSCQYLFNNHENGRIHVQLGPIPFRIQVPHFTEGSRVQRDRVNKSRLVWCKLALTFITKYTKIGHMSVIIGWYYFDEFKQESGGC